MLIRMLHDNCGPCAHCSRNDHPPRILLAHLEGGEWVTLFLRVATLHARVVGSVNLYLVDRLFYVRARSCELDDLLDIGDHPVLRMCPVDVDVGIPESDRGLHMAWPGRAGRECCC